MFCLCFELFISVALKQWGYRFLCLFSLVIPFCTVVVYSSSVIFLWLYEVIFSEK